MSDNKDTLWSEAVEKAHRIYNNTKNKQMLIADLALSVCEITWGGVNVDGRYTVKRFALESGIEPKTLSSWIACRVNVYEKLNDGLKQKASFTDLSTVSKLVDRNTPPAEVNRIAKQFIGQKDFNYKMLKYLTHLRAIAFNVENKNALSQCKKATVEELGFYCELVIKGIKLNYGKKITFKDNALCSKFNVKGTRSASYALLNGSGNRSTGWIKDEDGFSVKISEKDLRVLKHLKENKGKHISPTNIGKIVGKHNDNNASAWACRSLYKLSSLGLVRRQSNGHYSFVKDLETK